MGDGFPAKIIGVSTTKPLLRGSGLFEPDTSQNFLEPVHIERGLSGGVDPQEGSQHHVNFPGTDHKTSSRLTLVVFLDRIEHTGIAVGVGQGSADLAEPWV